MGGVGGVLACVVCWSGLRGGLANLGCMLLLLVSLLLKYYTEELTFTKMKNVPNRFEQ